ncbi:DNA alkylation repair protein [Brevibacillus sp. 179-C9.3 HS]|uniref:DNA alkylation repair protein n=1 Tax=unclassified Brevibacillus TaxID=2684853 RepID=UPI0039A27ED1
MKPNEYTEAVKDLLRAHGDPNAAVPMEQYMKNHFPFLGIKSPQRKELTKQIFRDYGVPADWEQVARSLWALPEREYQYVALDVLEKSKKRLSPDHLALVVEFITTKSWWDTVDYLASHAIGRIFGLHPELIEPNTTAWMEGNNMWLQRTALLFQLSYKDKTDQKLLFSLIGRCAESKEFFIQKAIGWALREYAKTNPAAVREFVEATTLASLSRREALKHLS